MGLLDKLLNKTADKKSVSDKQPKALDNPECKELIKLRSFMRKLLESDRYIAKSEYKKRISDATETINYFEVLKSSGMLPEFSRKNSIKQ